MNQKKVNAIKRQLARVTVLNHARKLVVAKIKHKQEIQARIKIFLEKQKECK